MRSLSRTALIGLAMLSAASSVSAVSLASFTPRISGLPPTCQAVYTTTIEGCKAEDFGGSAHCSSACINGLAKIVELVLKNCANVDVGETSIIGVFQNGIGIQALCPGVSVTTVSSSSTTTTAAQTSAQATKQTTSSSTSSSTSTSTSTSSSSSSSATSRLDTDPAATSVSNPSPTRNVQPGASAVSSSEPAKPKATANTQLSNAGSGGGSPFDVVATGVSAQLRAVDVAATAFLATAFLFVVCL